MLEPLDALWQTMHVLAAPECDCPRCRSHYPKQNEHPLDMHFLKVLLTSYLNNVSIWLWLFNDCDQLPADKAFIKHNPGGLPKPLDIVA
jgi:hypothetical protein